MDANTIASFALGGIFRNRPRIAKAIFDNLDDVSAIFSLDGSTLSQALGHDREAVDAVAGTDLDRKGRELDGILAGGYRYVTIYSDLYPPLLRECPDAPLGLFVLSDSDLNGVMTGRNVAVVGTRDISSYGRQWCRKIVECLASSSLKPAIVSGLAFGVDINAHLAALDCGLGTIAVMGTGIDNIYPQQHLRHAERIAATPGCAVVSEYPPSSPVFTTSFLYRNRIIAGMSNDTVLVESRIKGGGMSTARQAASYSRGVYAVPGRNDDVRSQGCNMLIQAQTAEALVSCDLFLKSLGCKVLPKSQDRRIDAVTYYGGSLDRSGIDDAARMIEVIRGNRDISIEDLAERCSIDIRRALSIAGRLEADGFIRIDVLQRCSIDKNV